MPISLTATKIKDTYGQLLHVDGGVTSTLKTVYDGDGTATALKVSTTDVQVNSSPVLTDADIGSTVQAYDIDTTKNDVSNTFTTNQIINANSASDALRITQIGAGNALVVEDSANPDSTPFVIDANGNFFKGYTSSISVEFPMGFQINGTASDSGISQTRWANNTGSPAFYLAKSRGSAVATRGIVQNGDPLGFVQFAGDDGANFVVGANIHAAVDGTPGTNDMPGRLVFSTTADGASSPTERMRIDSAGRVGIGGTNTLVGVNNVVPITGGVSAWGNYSAGIVQSGVTTSAIYYGTGATTAASAFNVGVLSHYDASQGTIGAGSSVTTQYGFRAGPSLTGATTNIGFLSNIAAGTGRWNFYANGSADNYFAGRLGIGATAPSGYKLYVGGNRDENNGFGFVSTGTIQSNVVNNYTAISTYLLTTQAASFNLTNLVHVGATPTTFGAGSTVTNQYGFFADSALTGATNNYGFYSAIAAGTGRYNFYAAGSADNYFAGNTFVGNDFTITKSAPTIFVGSNAVSTGACAIEVGANRTGSGAALVDLTGDTTYSDYGLRLIRNGGANATSEMVHRGTGDLNVNAAEAAAISFKTSGAERTRIDANGNLIQIVNTTAPTLSNNRTMTFELTSNTSLKVVVRGSDGVTRSVTLTLA